MNRCENFTQRRKAREEQNKNEGINNLCALASFA